MVLKTVLIDLSGTLHVGNVATQNAVAALQRLRDAAFHIKFVTNTTKESRECLHDRLTSLGFQLAEDEIFTSLHAAKSLIEEKGWKKPMLLLEPAALEDFSGITEVKQGESADAVVIGLSPTQFCYPILNIAFRHLLDGASLVGIHQARYFKEPDGLSLGPGGFVKALEYAASRQAIIVGKPESSFFLAALNNCSPDEAVMIGDDVLDDIDGAQKCGIRGILVKTGKYRENDEIKIHPRPNRVCESFHEAVEEIIREFNREMNGS